MANYRIKIGSASLGLSQQVISVGWDSVIEWKKESDSRNYSINPKTDWLISCARLPSDWGLDKTAVFQDLVDASDDCETFECSVEVECPAGSDNWEERWSGEFSSKDWKVSDDKKTLSVKPKENNPLDCLKENWKKDENIYNIVAWETVKPYFNIYKDKQRVIVGASPADPCLSPPSESGFCHYETESIPGSPPDIPTKCIYYYHRFEKAGGCSGSTPTEPDDFTDWTILQNNCPTSSVWWTCPEGSNLPFTFIHGTRLGDVIQYLLDQSGCGLTVVSDFLNINPDFTAPSNDAYTAAADKLQHLLVFQKSDIKRHDATDAARRPAFKIKLADLMADLKVMFQMDWTVTDAGSTFRLEHVSYFSASVGNDYTASKYKKELERDRNDTPRITRFFYRDEKCSDYFRGFPIEIDCGEDEKELRLSLFSVDLEYIVSDDGLESIGDDGFVLICADDIGGTLYNIDNNRPLAWSELLYNYYRHNMAGAGSINELPVTPLSLKKTRKQPSFNTQHCCGDTFEPFDVIVTSLGEGEVQSAEWNIAKDYLEIEAKY